MVPPCCSSSLSFSAFLSTFYWDFPFPSLFRRALSNYCLKEWMTLSMVPNFWTIFWWWLRHWSWSFDLMHLAISTWGFNFLFYSKPSSKIYLFLTRKWRYLFCSAADHLKPSPHDFFLDFFEGVPRAFFSQGTFDKLFLLFWSNFWDFWVAWVVYVDENIHVLWFFLDLIITSNLGLLLYQNLRPSKAISFEKVLVGNSRPLRFLSFLCLTWLDPKCQTKVTFFFLFFSQTVK